MTNLHKYQQIKKKREHSKIQGNLGTKNEKEIRDVFLYPQHLIEQDPQAIFLPFIAYNAMYPFEATQLSLQRAMDTSKQVSFSLIGRLARVIITFKNFWNPPSRYKIQHWVDEKESFLRTEIKKAAYQVQQDLDQEPATIWYNKIYTQPISFNAFLHIGKEIHTRLSDRLVILTNGSSMDDSGNIPISFIKLPI